MRKLRLLVSLMVLMFGVSRAWAADDTDDFAQKIDVSPLETVIIQHDQTLKTMDSFARQTLSSITGKGSFQGQPALFTVLDMSFRPEAWAGRNIIKIKNVPLRKDLQQLQSISEEERERIVHDGLVSLNFWHSPELQNLLQQIQSSAVYKANAVDQFMQAANAMDSLGANNFPVLRIVTPATTQTGDRMWHNLGEMAGNVPAWVAAMKAEGGAAAGAPAPLPNYSPEQNAVLAKVGESAARLAGAWKEQNVAVVNKEIAALADLLPQLNPALYPSTARRNVEVAYNRLAKMTIPGAAFYFFAFVLFLMAARSGVPALRLWGLRMFVLGYLIHLTGVGVRWWLVAGQHGSWFDGIPIKNQFESVFMSAWFGATVGLILELRWPKAVFGAAASFVGWLSLVTLFATPIVAGRDIGGEIGQVNGVLMSYWLYIHVTMVTASYALITMGFCLSSWWLIRYYRSYGTLRRTPGWQVSSDAARGFDAGYSGGGAVMSVGQTLAQMIFLPVSAKSQVAKARVKVSGDAQSFLATLDLCNLVVLQLAFWILGAGIICGAIWADESWGRPWGWDPKETFALVTWIVYLIVVHVRVATEHKAWWTAVLSVIGFFVMLFNWIGVNFFLVGLHSYA